GKSIMGNAADDASAGQAQVESEESARKRRRPPWKSTWEAAVYLAGLPRAKARKSDKISAAILFIGMFSFTALLIMPNPNFVLYMASDLFCGLGICMFLLNRFGIIGTLGERQAPLIWDLMLCMFMFGMFFVIN